MKRIRSPSLTINSDDERWEYWDDRRSDIDNEISEDLFNQITDSATEVIMPTHVSKYYGRVFSNRRNKWNPWVASFSMSYPTKFFPTEQEAIDCVKEVNSLMGWAVKNIVYKCNDDEYYCYLTRGQFMKFSYEHMSYVQNHVWNAGFSAENNKYYAETTIGEKGNRKMIRYHKMVKTDLADGEIVDHFNRITLDNTVDNLRAATFRTNSLNQETRVDSKTGISGVSITSSSCVARWFEEDGREGKKYFNINLLGDANALRMAIEYRKEKERTLPHYRLALQNM